MASVYNYLTVLSAMIVLCLGQGNPNLSRKVSDLKADINDAVERDVSKACYDVINQTLQAAQDDAHVMLLNVSLQGGKSKHPGYSACTQGDFQTFLGVMNDKMKDLEHQRQHRLEAYAKTFTSLSPACKAYTGSLYDSTTWLMFQEKCEEITGKFKDHYQEHCHGDQYSDLKRVVCDGTVANLSSLITLGLSLVVSLYGKF